MLRHIYLLIISLADHSLEFLKYKVLTHPLRSVIKPLCSCLLGFLSSSAGEVELES